MPIAGMTSSVWMETPSMRRLLRIVAWVSNCCWIYSEDVRAKRVTIYDIALAAEVSPSTVSRALSRPDEISAVTVARIRRISHELGYDRIGEETGFDRVQSNLVSVVTPDIGNPFQAQCVKSIQYTLSRHGYGTLIQNTFEHVLASEATRQSQRWNIDGVILLAPRISEPSIRKIADAMPLVTINRPIPGLNQVSTELAQPIIEAVCMLKDAGCRTVAYLSGPKSSWSNSSRSHAVAEACRRLDLEFKVYPYASPTLEGGFTSVGEFRAKPADAVVAFNDIAAIGFMAALDRAGIEVPGDVSVVGIDDILLSRFSNPPLATIRIPAVKIGEDAAKILVRSIRRKGIGVPDSVFEKAEFIPRGSIRQCSESNE